MPTVEINGRQIEVRNGATVMDAANALGIAIPHFCYHKKLSIAANCRMCLVQVEKAPKPLPACATPVTEGMKVFTDSEYARTAQPPTGINTQNESGRPGRANSGTAHRRISRTTSTRASANAPPSQAQPFIESSSASVARRASGGTPSAWRLGLRLPSSGCSVGGHE